MAQKTIFECTYLGDNIIISNWKYLLKLSEMKDKTYQERGKFGRTIRVNSKKPKTK